MSGLVLLGVCPSCDSIHVPLLVIGGAALGVGIPLLAKGIKRRRAFDEAMQERQMFPVVARTRYGWTGGLRFRF